MIKILCAAVWVKDDSRDFPCGPENITGGYVVCGRRHSDCFETLHFFKIKASDYDTVQGFLTSDDRFVDRNEAAVIALDSGQIESEKPVLYSENLY